MITTTTVSVLSESPKLREQKPAYINKNNGSESAQDDGCIVVRTVISDTVSQGSFIGGGQKGEGHDRSPRFGDNEESKENKTKRGKSRKKSKKPIPDKKKNKDPQAARAKTVRVGLDFREKLRLAQLNC